jgi:seryl-tRNA synthetase
MSDVGGKAENICSRRVFRILTQPGHRACYPVYPIAASRGPLPQGGLRFDVAADCFRHEPSRHLDRLQSFRMREYVCIGSPDDVSDFRERWMVRAQAIARDLGLTFKVDYASDPFFGRVGQMKAVSQKQHP